MTVGHALTVAAPVVAAATMLSACGGHASSTRAPTKLERAAIQQAIFDFAAANPAPVNPTINRIRVTPVPAGTHYAAFALADISDPKAGYAAVLLGYRKTPLSGWRVFEVGSAEVGCDLGSAVYGARKQAVLRAFGLDCPMSVTPSLTARKHIALIAHDNLKADLLDWARYNRGTLAKHELYATGTTGTLLAAELGLDVNLFLSGPLGGDQQIGAAIAEGRIDFVIFFWDPLEPHPHDVDVKALLRIAVVYNVPIACNRATADFVLSSPLLAADYNPDPRTV